MVLKIAIAIATLAVLASLIPSVPSGLECPIGPVVAAAGKLAEATYRASASWAADAADWDADQSYLAQMTADDRAERLADELALFQQHLEREPDLECGTVDY